ncbi:MAG: glycosyltransferase family 1 protein [Desulfovibrio sp.]|nr:glycosyltransferase family 1 protein [Desulfovibrio sp.]
MRTVIFLPPLGRASGGLTALRELAGILATQGRAVAVAGPWEIMAQDGLPDVERLVWDGGGAFLKSGDIWLVPEGWPNALVPGLKAGARVLVYVQNWAFLVTALPDGLTWQKLARAQKSSLLFLSVSGPVRHILTDVLGLDKKIVLKENLPPAVHSAFFGSADVRGGGGRRRGERVRIAYMPRKNKAMAEQILRLTLALPDADELEFVSIHNKSLEDVAQTLFACHIFLSTGFPEGFALPPAEAMAAGCVPVGFSGLGGFEYMRNPEPSPLPGLFTPPFPLETKPWGGNGLFVADGDVLGAARALRLAVNLVRRGNGLWRELVRNGKRTALSYNRRMREERAARLWNALEQA